MEDVRYEAAHIAWSSIRKEHAKRTLPPDMVFVHQDYRQRVETAASLIARRWPNTLHAVAARGFELKVFLFVLAYSLDCL